jgi:DNA-binding ferritin-like protein (Dps family)
MIADTLAHIVSQGTMDIMVKQHIEDVIKFAKEAKMDGGESNKGSTEQITMSNICDVIKVDLVEMYNTLANQLNGVHSTVKVMHTSVNQAVQLTEEAKTDAKELASKIGKVTDVMDKIASDTTSYRDALLTRPMQMIRAGMDPRILSIMEMSPPDIWA